MPTKMKKCWDNDNTVWQCTLSQLERSTLSTDATVNLTRAYDLAFIPDREALPGNCGLGQLTSIGYNQELDNGKNLHDAYVATGLLPPLTQANEVDVFLRSDDCQRTIESGQAVISAMFPPSSSDTTEVFPWLVMDKGVYYKGGAGCLTLTCVCLVLSRSQSLTSWASTRSCAQPLRTNWKRQRAAPLL